MCPCIRGNHYKTTALQIGYMALMRSTICNKKARCRLVMNDYGIYCGAEQLLFVF